MPCRREEEEEAGEEAEGEEEEEDDSFLLLEQSVTLGGSGEVDRLVAQIGETLQLDAAQDSPASPRLSSSSSSSSSPSASSSSSLRHGMVPRPGTRSSAGVAGGSAACGARWAAAEPCAVREPGPGRGGRGSRNPPGTRAARLQPREPESYRLRLICKQWVTSPPGPTTAPGWG
uniref:Uncharacterized protein n=1 Tax=Equus asinus TaxID=9793 RepID=A0A9L0I6B4_EQUAS